MKTLKLFLAWVVVVTVGLGITYLWVGTAINVPESRPFLIGFPVIVLAGLCVGYLIENA